jgi:hypothetical protein
VGAALRTQAANWLFMRVMKDEQIRQGMPKKKKNAGVKEAFFKRGMQTFFLNTALSKEYV